MPLARLPCPAHPALTTGFHITEVGKAYNEDELLAVIPTVHAIGLRSKTQLSAKVLAAARRLLCAGCFCIGTDQVSARVKLSCT